MPVSTPPNCAFVFIKPHAVTSEVKAVVEESLVAAGLKITSQGSISAKEIDEGKLIDNHYYAIASKATLLTPDKLNVPAEKFKKEFGIAWEDALRQGLCYNAMDACKKLGLDADGLDKLWGKTKKANKLVKFGGGFYCGEVQEKMYVFNGFFMSMRSKFVSPGVSIYYYCVEWDPKKLTWEDFRGQVLGATDPSTSPTSSLRGNIYTNWKSLGLAAQPDTGDNGVHASASPFEALVEQMNWLKRPLESCSFGQALLSSGISRATIEAWTVDPQVTYGPTGIVASVFDSLEDTNSDECLALASMLNGGGSNAATTATATATPMINLIVAAVFGALVSYAANKHFAK